MNNFEGACHLEVWCEWVGQSHVTWEGNENEVSHLDAVRRDDIAERKMVVTEKLWEVVKQHKQHS